MITCMPRTYAYYRIYLIRLWWMLFTSDTFIRTRGDAQNTATRVPDKRDA